MSEKVISRPEQPSQNLETNVQNEHSERIQKHAQEQAARAIAEKSSENIQAIRELANQQSQEASKSKPQELAETRDDLIGMHASLKSTAYARTLRKIQQKLSTPSRVFSKISHNPVIDKISVAGSQTVARPSGLLGGSICAFLGSLVVLYYSKHYGFKYNYLLLLILFICGFLVGSILEFVIWLAYKRRKHEA